MKKNFCLLVTLLLLLVPFKTTYAKDTQEFRKITKVHGTGLYVNVSDINNAPIHSGQLFEIELDNVIALCMDANHPIHKGLKYKLKSTIERPFTADQQWLVKAYLYASSHKGDSYALAASQIIVWKGNDFSDTGDPGKYENSHVFKIFHDAYFNMLKKARPNDSNIVIELRAVNLAVTNYIGIVTTPIPDDLKNLGIWEDVNNKNNQKVLSVTFAEEEELAKEACQQYVFNGLMDCYGTGTYTYGKIFQDTVGDCQEGYNKKLNNQYSKLGAYEKSANLGSYCRMYCNKAFGQKLPGNISKAVNVGRYIVWPNNNIEDNRYKTNANLSSYPMELSLSKTCQIGVAEEVKTDYKTAYNNYSSYIRSNSSVYNGYRNSNYSCSSYQNAYNSARAYYDSISIPGCDRKCVKIKNAKNPKLETESCSCANQGDIDSANSRKSAAANAMNAAKSNLDVCNEIVRRESKINDVIKEFNTCIGFNASISLDFSIPGISVSYNDDEYGKSMGLKITKTEKDCSNCSSTIAKFPEIKGGNASVDYSRVIDSKINLIKNRVIIGSVKKTYDLQDGYYYYINKDDNKSLDYNNGLKNYSYIGFSNMPVSYGATSSKKYDLKVNMPTVTGDASIFAKEISANNYVCHYSVTKTTPSSCVCPEGTLHAGESLDCLSKNNTGTCLDNQEEYCNSTSEIPHGCELTCPNDPSMDLSSCVNTGRTYDSCANEFCNGKKWVCPAGTNEGMDLSSCVIPMIVKGYSEKDAYEYCRDVTCPYGGIKIIYRVIDLTNPFPSKDADSIVTQHDLHTGMFNDELKGRYPGANWNSTKVVKSKILNNRTTDGDKVYNKEPIYTFVIDSGNIKEIRKYNNAQRDSYADFKLNCLDSKTACKSEFVHNRIYGLTGGTCQNVSKGNFYTCNN